MAPFRAIAWPGASWIVLGLCLVGTILGWQISLSQAHNRAGDRFQQNSSTVQQAIGSRIRSYEQLLKGARGLFAASRSVEREEWTAYVTSLGIQTRYPGISAMGFIARVSPADREEFVKSNRLAYASLNQGAGYTIFPPGDRRSYSVVQYVYPEESNLEFLGYDIATEPRRNEAAEAARDTGEAALTRRIRIGPQDHRPAVIMLLPVYRNDTSPTNKEERMVALEGWVYASFIMEELMAGLIESSDLEIDFEIFDDYKISVPG
ncbi:MAG TPA: CHASE domain-containing protein, partial [Candidatus Saccharimonadales bacterium]|nr:CHASE domain-containing protein [Candidatus Saccharimonadales bacterium]